MGFNDETNVPQGPFNPKGQCFETVMLHAGQETPDPTTGSRAPPVYLTTSYVFDDCDAAADVFALRKPGNIYSRLTNPTTEAFETRIAGGTPWEWHISARASTSIRLALGFPMVSM